MSCACGTVPCSCSVSAAGCGAVDIGCPPTPAINCGLVLDPATGQLVPAPGVCAPGLGNVPISSLEYQASIGVCLQGTIDEARRLSHELGFRPYRVMLLWSHRNTRQRSTPFRAIELIPVQVTTSTDVARIMTPSGMERQGGIVLSNISPAQVGYNDLLGKLDNQNPGHDIEFFYEVSLQSRCTLELPGGEPYRYTPASEPYFDAENYEWIINLTDQNMSRSDLTDPTAPADRDESFRPATRTSSLRT